ncbi:hypothetical protein ABW20_dc0108539 [Dactylellina cionopaga]|nr:hypothetical protein ABW20_dc0108539 [Dactylellina cionopaga]
MKFLSISTLFAAVLPIALVNAGAIPGEGKELWMGDYKLENGVLSGEVWAKQMNCGPVAQPPVQIFWAVGDKFQETPIEATRGWFDSRGNVWFNFRGNAAGATQFYVKLTCGERVLYDPGNFVNYQIAH